ncbi:MAG: TlyA family RNA methyltransferase [Mycoplasmatales bacterium]|nr:TlyA family RNA methyltransferase [Mycoplasmatales bacterium]
MEKLWKKLKNFDKFQGSSKEDIYKLIKSGRVRLNSDICRKPNKIVRKSDTLYIFNTRNWASRGSHKLLKAINYFEIDVENKVAVDIGASAGGFTHVLLEKGIGKVYAVELGRNLLIEKLRKDKRVFSKEGTHFKELSKNDFKEDIDLVVIDISFNSLKNAFPTIKEISNSKTQVIALIKPVFEMNNKLHVNGFLKRRYHKKAIKKVMCSAEEYGFTNLEIIYSPLKGRRKHNIEYLALFVKK